MTTRALLALTTGVALGLSGPPWDQPWIAWVALVPLLAALRGCVPLAAGALAWLAGTAWHALALVWLVDTLAAHTALPFLACQALWLAAASCIGLSTGAAVATAMWAARRGWPLALVLPVAWMAFESTQGWPVASFPWTPLGLSQHAAPGVAAWAATVGTVGLSGIVVLVNVLVALAAGRLRLRAWCWAAAAAVIAVALVGGARPIHDAAVGASDAHVLRLGLVQGHVPPRERTSPYDKHRVLVRYERLSAQVAPAVDLLVWPEAAVPFYFGDDAQATRRIRSVAQRHRTPLLFGSPGLERLTRTEKRYTNRALLLAADGRTRGTYTKRRLAPFGEYVPYGRWLPSIRPFIGTPQSLEAGAGPPVLMLPDGTVAGVLLCFESVFPALARAAVAGGARLLLNLANDAWFAGGAPSAQSLAHARMRAVELGVPVVRVANEGVSAVVDPAGRVVWTAPAGRMHADVVEVAFGARTGRTPFARWGGWGPAGLWAALVVMVTLPPRRRRAA